MKKVEGFGSKFILLILFIIVAPTFWPLFKSGYIPVHDSIHIARIYEMYQSLKDYQFPVRWAADLRYGEPLFNFYAPLPFYLGSFIHYLHFNFLDTAKILQILGIFLSSLTMFYLSKEFFGKIGGLISATLYAYAPYHSVDVYVRGALSEALALIFFPLVFLYSFKLTQKRSTAFFLPLTLSLAGLFYTHNIMTILFLPLCFAWWVFLIFKDKNFFLIKPYLLSLILAFTFAASYLLPAYFEKDLIQTNPLTSGYYDYRAHFVELSQFFFTFWGYGASVWGPYDGLSFQIGLVHWSALLASATGALILKKKRALIVFLTLTFLFSLFMQHNKSTFIWTNFPLISFAQFPWRFLGISIFLVSLIGGFLAKLFPKELRAFSLILIFLIVFYNLQFFHPQFYYESRTDADYVSSVYLTSEGFSPKDYVPIFVKVISSDHLDNPRLLEGKGKIESFDKHSTWAKFRVSASTNSDLEVPITYFPGWTVYANNQRIDQEKPTDLGLIHFKLPAGNYSVYLQFENTLIRSLGNAFSLISVVILVGVFLYKRQVEEI